MAEVKRSTLQSAGIKGDTGANPSAFDLNSWQGLTAVLQAGRDSGLNSRDYAVFRDLVLEYAQKRGDVELRKKIDLIVDGFSKKNTAQEVSESPSRKEKSVTQNSTPEVKTDDTPAAPQGTSHIIQSRRPTPTFIPKQVEELLAPKPDPLETSTVISPTEGTELPPSPLKSVDETVIPYSVEHEEETPEKISLADDVPHVGADIAQDVPPKPSTPETLKSVEEYRTRIMEIKRLVNAHVGNPVTLIDSENNLGRTYMNALLTAMKATGPGSTQDQHSAMATLEEAYRAVEEHVNQIKNPAIPKQPTQLKPEEPIQEVTHEPETAQGSVSPQSPVPDEISEPKEESIISPITSPEPETEILSQNETPEPAISQTEEPEKNQVVEVLQPQSEALTPQSEEERNNQPQARRPRMGIPSLLEIESDFEDSDVLKQSKVLSTPSIDPYVSNKKEVTETTTLPDMRASRLTLPITPFNSPIEVKPTSEAPIRQDELVTPEVSTALNQLLHEWKIFSSSGLFGIGPGGIDHPLYLQLSKLSMGEVISGRWEGAKPEIKRSIKDYIDAWRHEQAIAYSPTETFEHYLRRVVQRILKRQKGGIIV